MQPRKPFTKKKAPFPPFNPIRVAARAVIVRDGKLLVVILRDDSGPFYILPGGGQKHGETLAEAVRRECSEELGIAVRPGKMLYIREYIGRNHAFKARHKAFHQVEVVFECEIENEDNIGHGSEEDKRQVGFTWVPLSELREARLFPSVFKTFLREDNTLDIPPGYLGDIN
ncbi:MAG: NUDIX domain-containing protein [Opitutales bacterium]|nr:NUDIX domain-containing protein [Opitutales bacterium]MBQ9758626.1 NUDIX domain-containing protein [Opitutales bacterium]